MALEKGPQVRHDMQAGEGHRGADPQRTAEPGTGPARSKVGFVGLF
ncbi:hypothetical protein C4K18_1656 [Pseudomonas chlororaphis subsp. aurantiaca]|nr:hypothetical protein C4K18_1656 [Pseudomonas chlororaphis subsp. aurantiaca]